MIFFLAGCKKEKKDTQSPLISISNPAEGQIFSMFDTMQVTAHVSDETHLTSIVVALTDLNNIPVQGNYPVSLQSNDFTFTINYVISEFRLLSGFYYLSVTANDGTNSRQSTRKIYINESPTLKTGYYIVGATQPKNVIRYDAAMVQKNLISLTTGFTGMAYSGYNHQLYINGHVNQSLQAVDAAYNEQLNWTSAYSVGSNFTSIYTDGKKPYIGYYSGSLSSFASSGGYSTSYINNNTGYYPVYFTTTSTYGVGIYKDKFGIAGNQIITFGKNNGIAINSRYTPCYIVGIFERTQDELYILGNDTNSNPVIYLYSVTGNFFTGPMSLPAGKLVSAVQIDSDYLIFAAQSGNIYGYRFSTNNAISLASINAQKISFQPKMYELTASSKNNLYTYSLSGNYNLTQVNMQVLADSIIGFEVVTNK